MTKYNAQMFGKVVVLMGGFSSEREISLESGETVLSALIDYGIDAYGIDVHLDLVEKLLALKPDRAFIAMHGMGGEDGSIQGLLQYLGIPYTGTGITGSAITIDKNFAKLIWQRIGVATPKFRLVTQIEDAINIMKEFGLPLCVKPTNNGSSIGVSKVTEPEQLSLAFTKASLIDNSVIIEPWIEGIEYTVGILGNAALPVIEIRPTREFFDFDAKYKDETTEYICPTDLSPEREQELQDLALRAFIGTACYGWGRVDLIVDNEGNAWFLEVNTIPGMALHSLVPKAASVLGLSFGELVIEILSMTLEAEESLQSAA